MIIGYGPALGSNIDLLKRRFHVDLAVNSGGVGL